MENINWKTLFVIPTHGEFTHVDSHVYAPNTLGGARSARGRSYNRVVLVDVKEADLHEEMRNTIWAGTRTYHSINGKEVEFEIR